MANKKSLLGGAQIKVENVSGFDKSRFNAFTAPLGAIVPMAKQLMIPGKFKLSVKLSAQLPPLASDAFLRTHLKVEAFLVPLRLCYGGFESWFSGREIAAFPSNSITPNFTRAKLPYLSVALESGAHMYDYNQAHVNNIFGVHTLFDYFGCKFRLNNGNVDVQHFPEYNPRYNLFPFLCYGLIYDHWYRNKLIEKPLFSPVDINQTGGASGNKAFSLPWIAAGARMAYSIQGYTSGSSHLFSRDNLALLNGNLLDLRYRNYGYDYFTTALPSAQEGSPMSVDTSGGSFTISALRMQNALQHFAEVNQLAGPDMVQANKARYGVDLSDGVASRPILLGSADFPMFTSGVEQTAQGAGTGTNNPFGGIAARYGRAHAEGSDFVCEGSVKEPSYLMVMCSLVPEANYATGIAKDMRIFINEGSLTDLPVSMLEQTGYEPVYAEEIYADTQATPQIFGYQPRYMWHKAGAVSEVHGLFRSGASLASFIPQREFASGSVPFINTAFLKVKPTDLDGVMAVSGALSQYGVMVDSAIQLFVSEPLGESALPSLVDPAEEHGYTVYVKRGGQSL